MNFYELKYYIENKREQIQYQYINQYYKKGMLAGLKEALAICWMLTRHNQVNISESETHLIRIRGQAQVSLNYITEYNLPTEGHTQFWYGFLDTTLTVLYYIQDSQTKEVFYESRIRDTNF